MGRGSGELSPVLRRSKPHIIARLWQIVLALAVLALGADLVLGGGRLLVLGGSAYYLVAGIGLLACSLCLFLQWREAIWIYGFIFVATCAWSIYEVGFAGWALVPRIVAPTVVAVLIALPASRRGFEGRLAITDVRASRAAVIGLGALAVGVGFGVLLHVTNPSNDDPIYQAGTGGQIAEAHPANAPLQPDWRYYGGDQGGNRFSTLEQLTPRNVEKMRVAWVFRTGLPATGYTNLEVTPLKIGSRLYLCDGTNDIFALDAETGRQVWRFMSGYRDSAIYQKVCRGVAYYEVPGAAGPCSKRIITATVSSELIALDAETGQLCPMFGANGRVNLLKGMGNSPRGYYLVTSAPTIVNGNIIVGGWITDGQFWGEPPGVVRAYNAVTGAFAWAFDAGRPHEHGEPGAGRTYTLSTPNSWGPMSGDEQAGLVYFATGSPTGADFYGGHRRPFDDQYNSSIIALDSHSGEVRWSFQTVHHDLWDYDIGAQPTLTDISRGGRSFPAVVVSTKEGEIFILDRLTGKPLFPVAERPVPQGGTLPGERLSPTQPFSVGLPSFRGPVLREQDMWGISPIDQLSCRIKFREARYDGIYTPPGAKPSVVYPGYGGGINWGGVSIDQVRHIMIVNSVRIGNYNRMIPRPEANSRGIAPVNGGENMYKPYAQLGSPYAANPGPFLSFLSVPCQAPPYGVLSAVNLETGKLIWSQSFGTARDSGPLGYPTLLPIRMGVPNIGGSCTSSSGLTFIAATMDRFLRAYETTTGKLLWKGRLPAGGQATPMTYFSAASGRQFVLVAAGGSKTVQSKAGDYIVAYAIPH